MLVRFYNAGENYLCINRREICKLQANDNIRCYIFCIESVSKDFTKEEQSEVSLNGTVYDFSVDHSSIKK